MYVSVEFTEVLGEAQIYEREELIYNLLRDVCITKEFFLVNYSDVSRLVGEKACSADRNEDRPQWKFYM